MLTAATRRGVRSALLVADLPFGSYEASDEQAIRTSQRFVKEAHADAVKLEGGERAQLSRVRAIVAAGIPVMGHVGLTPQTATALGGRRRAGRTAQRALSVAAEAIALEQAGAFAVVFEAIPASVATEITALLEIPVIGIGAGTPPTARCSCSTTCSASTRTRTAVREAVRRTAPGDGRRGQRLRRGGPHTALPDRRAQLLDRSGGAAGVPRGAGRVRALNARRRLDAAGRRPRSRQGNQPCCSLRPGQTTPATRRSRTAEARPYAVATSLRRTPRRTVGARSSSGSRNRPV